MALGWGTRVLPATEVACALAATAVLAGATWRAHSPHPRSHAQQLASLEESELKWLHGRSLATEARVRPVLDRAFETSSGVVVPYRLTCDDDDCLLIIDDAVVDTSWWWQRFGEYTQAAGFADGMDITSQSVFFDVPAVGTSAGYVWMRQVTTAFEDSIAIAECKRRFPQRGTISFKLRPDLHARTAPFTVRGSLANTPIASCAEDVLTTVLEQNPMPLAMTYVWSELELGVRVR